MSESDDDSFTRCIAERIQDMQCDKDALEEYHMCEQHLKEAIQEFDSVAVYLAICNEQGQVDPSEQRQYERMRKLLENQGVNATRHGRELQAICQLNDESTATKRIDTVETEFLDQHLPNYNPQY
ncbi:MAG: hypothetical protein ABEI77_02305 [Halorientalis sp.]